MKPRTILMLLFVAFILTISCAALAQGAAPASTNDGKLVIDASMGWPVATTALGGQALAGLWLLLRSVTKFLDKAASDGICFRIIHCNEQKK